MEYHARILSRLFWPGLEREHFLLPAEVAGMQKRYEEGYEGIKSRRKLTWLNQMGQVRVELEMRDRTVTVDCTPIEATVVHAFQGEGEGDDSPPVQKSVDELYETLQMDEDLIAAALRFWASKGVLRRVGGGSGNAYVVVETLGQQDATPTGKAAATSAGAAVTTATTAAAADDDEHMQEATAATSSDPAGIHTTTGAAAAGGAAAAADEPPAAVAAGKPSAKERARREVYWRYVQGMLTNASASMPLAQMGMMLRMLIADGFPWSDEELGAFLGEKVAGGEMEVVGGRYRLVKK
jgi:anaphase-promoting complex subunit 2